MATWVFRRKPQDNSRFSRGDDDDDSSPAEHRRRRTSSPTATNPSLSAMRFATSISKRALKINPVPDEAAEGALLDNPVDPKMKGQRLNSLYGRSTTMQIKSSDFDNQKRSFQLDPNSTFKRRWDIAQAVILVYIALVVPFRVGYKQPAEGVLYAIDLLIDLYFYIDIVFNFITGYPHEDDEEVIVYNPWMICKNYAKTWMTIDVIACLPIDMVLRIMEGQMLCSLQEKGCPAKEDGSQSGGGTGQLLRLFKLLRLFRLMKLLRLFKIMRLFEKYQDDLFKFMHLLSVGKLIIILLYMGHIFGCFFHYFSAEDWRTPAENQQIVDGRLEPWLKQYFEDGEPTVKDVWDRYIASMYWAFTTMTTVGYGDISATTRCERVIACFGMIVGGFVFSGIIGTMSEVMANTDLSKKAHAHKMESVSAFIRDTNLPKEYLKEALAFFRKQDVKGYNQHGLLMEMPYHLRRKILYHHYKHIIYKVPLFDVDGDGGLDDHVFVTELCTRLKQVIYSSGQYIYQQGEIGRHMFILAQGQVEIVEKNQEMVLTVLEPGAYFGEGCILGDVRRRENMRASGSVELCKLDANDLDIMLDTYPHLHNTLHDAYYKRKELFDQFEKARADNPGLTLEGFIEMTERKREAGIESPTPTAGGEMTAAEAGGDAAASAASVGGGGGDAASGGDEENGNNAEEGGEARPGETTSSSSGVSDNNNSGGVSDEDGYGSAGGGVRGDGSGSVLPTLAEEHSAASSILRTPVKGLLVNTSSLSKANVGSHSKLTRQNSVNSADRTLSLNLTPKTPGPEDQLLKRNLSLNSGQNTTAIKKLELTVSLMAEKHVKMEKKMDEMMASMKRMEQLLLSASTNK